VGQYVRWVCTVRLDLPPNPLNEGPYVVGFVPVLPSPHRLQQLAVQHDLSRIASQVRKHFELASRQRYTYSYKAREPSGEVDLQVPKAVGQLRSPWSGRGPSEQRLDPGEQLCNANGLVT